MPLFWMTTSAMRVSLGETEKGTLVVTNAYTLKAEPAKKK